MIVTYQHGMETTRTDTLAFRFSISAAADEKKRNKERKNVGNKKKSRVEFTLDTKGKFCACANENERRIRTRADRVGAVQNSVSARALLREEGWRQNNNKIEIEE